MVSNPTTTTLWAGAQDATIAGGTVSFPAAGVILSGTAISTITGNPVRHLWYGDHLTGLCRMDPEVDAIVPAVNGIGGHAPTLTTCIGSIKAAAFRPGQLSFDSSTNTLYAPDISPTSNGIVRLHYLPSGDSGQGAIDPVHIEVLVSAVAGVTGTGGCTPPNDPFNGIVPSQADASALGPDGNLYVGFKLDGAVYRILSPATFNPALQGACQNNLQVPLFSADEKQNQSGHTFGLGWVGHFLFGADNIAPWVLANADQCLTPINGNKRCGPNGTGGVAATEILTAQVPTPSGGAVSDAQYPTFPGNTAYFATASAVTKVSNIVNATNLSVQLNYGTPTGGFCFVTGMTADPANLANENLYVGVDCTDARTPGTGAIWQITPSALACTATPLAPNSLTAVGGNAQAVASWSPTPNGCQITSYVVRTLLADGTASTIPDLTVTATAPSTIVPTTATVTGLTNGGSYEFEVQACNTTGCSAFSPVSNIVLLVVPGAPSGVSALAGNLSASVAWVPAPVAVGVPPTTSYTISAFDTLAPTVLAATATVPNGSGGLITGLLIGECYTFTVHATNAVGNSPESAPSLPVCIVALPADIAVAVQAPASVNAGLPLTFTITINNFGPGNAAGVGLTDTLSLPLTSITTTQGTCAAAGTTTFSCALGPMTAGASATVTVSVAVPLTGTASVTNSATVTPLDATGAAVADPTPGNNTASATVAVLSAPSTDIQVGGSAQNGGPAVGSNDTFTWQIKNNLGTTAAPGVVFTSTLPASFKFSSVSPSQGTCSAPAAGSLGGTITCSLGTINGGGQAIVTVNFVPTVAGTFSTTGSASFAGNDTNTANNQFTVTIQPK